MPIRPFLLALLILPLSGCGTLMLGSTLLSCTGRPTLQLLPETLPAGRVGQPYHAELRISAPASVHGFYTSDAEPLPPGLRIEHAHGESNAIIVGVPTAAGRHQVHLSAGTHGTQCVGQRAARDYRLDILE